MRASQAPILFDERQAFLIDRASHEVAKLGGPDAPGAASLSTLWAAEISATLDPPQRAAVAQFQSGLGSALYFTGMKHQLDDDPPPLQLPPPHRLQDKRTDYLASRSQILLHLVKHRAFAFDIDNQGRLVRLVGNFKGGGACKLAGEAVSHVTELSSHAGVALGPHTEPPYYCVLSPEAGHSPAPSSLILTARWNPENEPTHVFSLAPVLEKLSGLHALALTTRSFVFTRSECLEAAPGEVIMPNAILQADARSGFAARFSTYRYNVAPHASPLAKQALDALHELVRLSVPNAYVLQPDTALLIDNASALHGRATLRDNARLLVRLFGYSSRVHPLVIRADPLIVRG